MDKHINQKGITLVELVLYIGISSIMLLVLFAFYGSNLKSDIKNKAIHHTQTSGQQIVSIMQKLSQPISTITSPTAGNSSSTIVFTTASSTQSPIEIKLQNKNIIVTEDTDGSPRSYKLNSENVEIQSLEFTNLSSGTIDSFRYQTNIMSSTTYEANKIYNYGATYYGAITEK